MSNGDKYDGIYDTNELSQCPGCAPERSRREGRGEGKVKGEESCESRARKISERELAIRLLHCPEVAVHTKDLRQGT